MANQECGIYAITHTPSGKKYVGQAAKIRDRWLWHRSALRRGKHSNRPLQNAWNKYGEAAFEFTVLEHVPKDGGLLCAREQHWIGALRPEYNVAPVAGTTRGIKHPPRSAEFRIACGQRSKGRSPSAETRELLRMASTGRRHTPEARAKISAAMTGKAKTPEQVASHRAAMLGHKQSEQTIARRIASLTGQKRTPEQRARISQAKRAAYAARLALKEIRHG